MTAPAIELRRLSKAFGECVANADISLSVGRGTIHAVIGENGAGKTTAMKMLYGMFQPDSGEILVEGTERRWKSPADAIRAGIGMVHQHFMLADPYDAVENIMVGAEEIAGSGSMSWLPSLIRPLPREGALSQLRKISQEQGLEVDWEKPIEELPVGIQQRIEIIKLLYRNAQILILDEPTAVLTPQEAEDLFVHLRKLRDQGRTIIIITHKLKEVMALSDEVTVFRAGRVVGRVETARTSIEELATLMVGRKVKLTAAGDTSDKKPGDVVLEVRDLNLGRVLQGLSFEVRAGEIVGIAGVEGNGQSELLNALIRPRDFKKDLSGTIRVLGQEATRLSTRAIRELGVAFIPEDRHRDGLLLDESARENFLLGRQREKRFLKGPFIHEAALDRAVSDAEERFDVRPRSLTIPAGGLSGGNQQKLIIAREFDGIEGRPGLLIAAQPTRGVDVGAIEFIHEQMVKARANGRAVLLVSSELDEVLALSDRILVLFEGRFVGSFERGHADESRLGLAMGGVTT